jgi:hypothetical protein
LEALPLLADLFSVHRLRVGPLAEHGARRPAPALLTPLGPGNRDL